MSTTVTLRTGIAVPEPAVRTTMLSLQAVEAGNPIALYELVQLARNPSHALFGNTGEVLAGWGLVERDGSMPATTRDIILAAAEGGDFDLRIVPPLA